MTTVFNMDIILFIDVTIQAIAFVFVLYYLLKRGELDNNRIIEIITSQQETTKSTIETFIKEVSTLEQKHFEQSEKQLVILKEQSELHLTSLANIIESLQPKPKPIIPDLLDNEQKIENSIEKEEISDVPLEEQRFPLVDGLKVQFDDHPESFPIDIERFE